MALFGSKKNKDAEKKEASAKAAPKKVAKAEKAPKPLGKAPHKDVAHVLKQPRITEKASILSETSNIYVFEVDKKATKRDVVEAVRFYYKAEPVKVNMIAIPSKNVFVRGKWGVKSGGKKAYVYLQKGVTIEII